MPEMRVLDHTGHRSVSWTATDTASVVAASALFKSLQGEGHVPFASPDGAEPYQLREFDAGLECDIVWVRPIAGG